jgi:hypothetical protein
MPDRVSDGSSNSSGSSSLPDMFHVAAQLNCCFLAPPAASLPWLQLLATYHALLHEVDACELRTHKAPTLGNLVCGEADKEAAAHDDAVPRQLVAMAAALCSYGVQLPSSTVLLQQQLAKRYAWHDHVLPLLAMPLSTPVDAALRAQRQQPPQPPQQHADGVSACAYWLHAQRLVDVPPSQWQQHVAQHLLRAPGGKGSKGSSSSLSRQHLCALADTACDWCGRELQPAASGSSSSKRACASCALTQYCSDACAAAGGRVHGPNCWWVLVAGWPVVWVRVCVCVPHGRVAVL